MLGSKIGSLQLTLRNTYREKDDIHICLHISKHLTTILYRNSILYLKSSKAQLINGNTEIFFMYAR